MINLKDVPVLEAVKKLRARGVYRLGKHPYQMFVDWSGRIYDPYSAFDVFKVWIFNSTMNAQEKMRVFNALCVINVADWPVLRLVNDVTKPAGVIGNEYNIVEW
jgi:hypothetical protein